MTINVIRKGGPVQVVTEAKGPPGLPGVPFPGNGGTVTVSTPLADLSQTWNNAAETFVGIKANFIPVAAAAASLLLLLQTDSVDTFKVREDGFVTAAGGASFGAPVTIEGGTVWTSANDGPGSGLDADLLDGHHGAFFLDAANLTGTLPAANMPALTGDVTTAAGSVATTLATVNVNVGTFGSTTQVPVITVDGKGRIISVGNTTVTPAWGSVSGKPTTAAGMGLTDVVFLTGDQTIAGNKTFSGTVTASTQFLAGDGSVGAPSHSFVNGATSGLYWSAGAPRLAVAGALSYTFGGSQFFIHSNAATIQMGASSDILVTRDAADVLALRRSTNAQVLRAYNTFTDAANYERGIFDWSSITNTLTIGTQKAGTGATRPVSFMVGGTQVWTINTSGHWLGQTDNTYDVGTSGANRPRNIYAGTDVKAGANLYAVGSVYLGSAPDIRLLGISGGSMLLANGASTDFGRLCFGGTTGLFPALLRSTTGLIVRLADDTADTWIQASVHLAGDGSASAPSFAFASAAAGTGFYNSGSSTVALTRATTPIYSFGASNFDIFSVTGALRIGTDSIITRDGGSNILAMRSGAAAQTWRVYNTWTDASNYERGVFGYVSNVLTFGHEAAGTGLNRDVRIKAGAGSTNIIFAVAGSDRWYFNGSGHLLAVADNTYDLGSSGNLRPRTIYAGTSLVVPNVTFSSSIQGTGFIVAGASSVIAWSGRSFMASPADGAWQLTNNAQTIGVTMVAEASDVFSQRNGTTAQAQRVYNTWTDASNYERGVIDFKQSTNNLFVGAEALGTGVQRGLYLIGATVNIRAAGFTSWTFNGSGHMLASTDNLVDIGASGANRPRAVYVATDVIAGGKIQSAGDVLAGATGDIQFSSRGRFRASADGVILISNSAVTDFGRLQMGGVSASFPSLKRSTTGIIARLADDSADTWLQASQFLAGDGTAGAVGLGFASAANTGFFNISGTPHLSISGADRYAFGASSLILSGVSGAAAINFGSDTLLLRDGAANILAMRNTTSAQEQRWYSTYTDASNYERAGLAYTAGLWTLSTAGAGTGANTDFIFKAGGKAIIQGGGSRGIDFRFAAGTTAWQITSSGHFIAGLDNTYDIGASGATRPKDVYIAGTYRGAVLITTGNATVSGVLGVGASVSNAFITLGASSTGASHIKFTAGVARTSPSDGDFWFDGVNPNLRINGVSTIVLTSAALTVAALPSASTAGAGARNFVTDATTTLALGLGLAVTGGGANKVPVYSDGASWLIG